MKEQSDRPQEIEVNIGDVLGILIDNGVHPEKAYRVIWKLIVADRPVHTDTRSLYSMMTRHGIDEKQAKSFTRWLVEAVDYQTPGQLSFELSEPSKEVAASAGVIPADRTEQRLSEAKLPETAPVKWSERRKHPELVDLKPAAFIQAVYSEYLGKGMTTGTVGRLDPSLYQRHNNLPSDEKVAVSLLPNRDAITEARPLPNHEDLLERREKTRKFEREKKARYRAKARADAER